MQALQRIKSPDNVTELTCKPSVSGSKGLVIKVWICCGIGHGVGRCAFTVNSRDFWSQRTGKYSTSLKAELPGTTFDTDNIGLSRK